MVAKLGPYWLSAESEAWLKGIAIGLAVGWWLWAR